MQSISVVQFRHSSLSTALSIISSRLMLNVTYNCVLQGFACLSTSSHLFMVPAERQCWKHCVFMLSICCTCLHPGCCLRDTYGLHWWIFVKLLSVAHLGTEMNWLGFGVKRSEVKVTAWPDVVKIQFHRQRHKELCIKFCLVKSAYKLCRLVFTQTPCNFYTLKPTGRS